MGFGEILRFGTSSTCVGHVVSPRCCTNILRIIFGGLTNLFLFFFFFFRKFEFLINLGLEAKNGLGLQSSAHFENDVFQSFPGEVLRREDQFVKFLERCRRAVRVGPEMGLRLRCGGFFRVFRGSAFDTVFCEFEKGSFETPLSSFRVLLFSAVSFWVWVDATLYMCFGAVGPKPFIFFCFLFVCLQKHCFFPRERVIFVHLSVSPLLCL